MILRHFLDVVVLPIDCWTQLLQFVTTLFVLGWDVIVSKRFFLAQMVWNVMERER